MSEFDVSKVMKLALSLIKRRKKRPPDPQRVAELAASIQQVGLLNPIYVRELGGGKYKVIAGDYRHAACIKLKMEFAPVRVVKAAKKNRDQIGLIENLFRGNPSALLWSTNLVRYVRTLQNEKDRAKPLSTTAISRLMPQLGSTEGARRKAVERAIKIGSMPREVRRAARAAGLANNRRALLRLASLKSVKEQLAAIPTPPTKADSTQSAEVSSRRSSPRATNGVSGAEPQFRPWYSDPGELSKEESEALFSLNMRWEEAGALKRAFADASPKVRQEFVSMLYVRCMKMQ